MTQRHEDTMDIDSDGPSAGVDDMRAFEEYGMEVEMANATNEHDNLEAGADRHQYLQAKKISGQDYNDWANLPELPSRALGQVHTVANVYRTSFTTLLEKWGCSPASCIPEELRLATPYSLALVVRLAELARRTEGRRVEVHAVLSSICRERFANMTMHPQYQPGMIIARGMDRNMALKRFTEHRVQEYVSGLMIEDLGKAKFESRPLTMPDRASRAAKRANRPRVDSSGQEGATQQQDLSLETGVGERSWEIENRTLLQQAGKPKSKNTRKPQRLKRYRAQQAALGVGPGRHAEKKALSDEVTANIGEGTDHAATEDRVIDSAYVRHEEGFVGSEPKPARKGKNAKKQDKEVDKYMSRIFERINVKQNDLDLDGIALPPRSSRPPSSPQRNRGNTVLPSERLVIPSTPLSFMVSAADPRHDNE